MTEPIYRGNQAHFEATGAQYSDARQKSPANRRYYDYFSEWMLAWYPDDPTEATVLDCMAGSCELARVLAQRVRGLHAVDISHLLLRRTPPEDPQPDSKAVGDVHRLPYQGASFDLVMIRGGLHHVAGTFEQALVEIARVMKPGGWLICVEPSDDNPLIQGARNLLHWLSNQFEDEERGLHRDELRRALHATGFEQITFAPFGYVGYTLIGNTDVLPILRHLKSERIINALITIDKASPHLPLWKHLALTTGFRAQKCLR